LDVKRQAEARAGFGLFVFTSEPAGFSLFLLAVVALRPERDNARLIC